MAISNDERRQVAARLRAIDDTEWTHPREELRALDDALGTAQGMPHALQTTWERLADLIEPEPERTCHVVSTIRYDYEGGYAGVEYATNLSCGHKHTDSYGDAPNFCSECGARVVD